MDASTKIVKKSLDRRSFMRSGLLAGGAATIGAGMLANGTLARAQDEDNNRGLDAGDVAILRFLAAAELIEADLWTQYAELGGIGNNQPIEVNPNPHPAANPFPPAPPNLDTDGPQYISSNTLDEVSHAAFLNAYLESKGAESVNFDRFRTLRGRQATGSTNIGLLTNLMHLNVDTSWFIRYRSATNPDFGATFPQALTITNHTAIPITDADFTDPNHIQVIANIAAFHFGYIEQGGSSLYTARGRKTRS